MFYFVDLVRFVTFYNLFQFITVSLAVYFMFTQPKHVVRYFWFLLLSNIGWVAYYKLVFLS